MRFVYNPDDCPLTVEEIRDLRKRLDAAPDSGLLAVSDKELAFLAEQQRMSINTINATLIDPERGDLRDEFAKAALEGILAHPHTSDDIVSATPDGIRPLVFLARRCWKIADAVMAERRRRHDGQGD